MAKNVTSYALAGLDNFKDFIGDTGSTNDNFYRMLIKSASEYMESEIDRKLRPRSYTEYYDGKGTTRIFLNQYPILSTAATITVYDDINRNFTSTYLFDSDDLIIYSEEGYIEVAPDADLQSVFNKGVQNVKVTYDAGYSQFEVVTGVNDEIDFNEGGSELTATLDSGVYMASELATEIDTQLTDAGAGTYTVAYNSVTNKFTLTKSTGTFQLLWNGGSNAATNAGDLLGFLTSADDTGAVTYTADNERIGLPGDIEMACIMLSNQGLLLSQKGVDGGRLGIKTRINPQTMSNITYVLDSIPDYTKKVIMKYRRVKV